MSGPLILVWCDEHRRLETPEERKEEKMAEKKSPTERWAEVAEDLRNRSRKYDVSIPVTVRMIGEAVIGADVDFDGAPWAFVEKEPNVWDVEAEEWERNRTIEEIAIRALEDALANQFDGGEEQKPWPVTP